MKIYAYFCGELDHQFTDTDDKQVEEMCRRLDDPDNDTRSYELEGGRPILFWRRDGRIHGNTLGHDERDIQRAVSPTDFPPPGANRATRPRSDPARALGRRGRCIGRPFYDCAGCAG